jgi:serine/threonine protein kinase/formylglycine-generating enzyme required for sulfatase activity
MADWIPPEEFDGSRIVRLLGQGGMGQVYLGHDTLLDRQVAIKFVLSPHADEEASRRFLTEARAIARLQQPNVVSIHRIGEVGGYPYLVSEFVPGQSLDKLPRPMPWQKVLEIGIGLTRALAAAHQRGVVHRDVKPANVILSEDGEVKLLDFGIAKFVDAQRQAALAALKPFREPSPDEPTSDGCVDDSGSGAEELTADVPVVSSLADSADEPTSDGPASNAADDATNDLPAIGGFVLRPGMQDSFLSIGARSTDSLSHAITQPGVVLGTPSYMAPEVWRAELATFRSDVYSLGALLYALCSGHPPHRGRSRDELRYKVLFTDAPPLCSRAPQVDPAFGAIVDQCLKRDPELRYANGNEVRAALAQLTPEARAGFVPQGNPYRGLHAFEAEHCALYFGRDSEIRAILERLRDDPFVLVAGDSGVGKSSLCKAGVAPRLEGWMGKARTWKWAAMVPGVSPVRSLAIALSAVLGAEEAEVSHALLDLVGGFRSLIKRHAKPDTGIVLFVDQLEELVTQAEGKDAAAVAEALGWLAAGVPGVRLLATVRGDFLSRIASLPCLGEEVSRGLYFLRPLNAERVREAVEKPALAKGVSFESAALVEELVASTIGAEGSLPLLQFALAELWEAKPPSERVIRKAAVEAIGGVSGALARHADHVIASLPSAWRPVVRPLLLRMVTPDGTRSRRTAEELGAQDSTTQQVLDALVHARLVQARESADNCTYELTHEALLQGWPTLSRWLADSVQSRVVHERVRQAVVEWERLGRTREALWSGRQLQEARSVDPQTLSAGELAFLAQSRAKEQRSKRIRIGIFLGLPLAIVGTYLGMTLKSHLDIVRRTEVQLEAARQVLVGVQTKRLQLEQKRSEAFSRYDQQDKDGGERVWNDVISIQDSLRPDYSEAGQHYETAILLSPDRKDIRGHFADLLLDRALLAESQHDLQTSGELLQRMSLYDDHQMRLGQWNAPAILSLRAMPSDASLRLFRVNPAKGWALEALVVPRPLVDYAIASGSYLAELTKPGYVTTRHAFRLSRGDKAQIDVHAPVVGSIPDGYVLIPGGPFLFGSRSESRVRQDFFHTVPEHRIELPSFLISRFETSFADWLAFVDALPASERASRVPHVGKGGFQGALELKRVKDDWIFSFQPTTQVYSARWGEPIVYLKRDKRASQDWRRFPVVGITADDAQAYVSWLDQSGRLPGARLCTEYEWEKAARGADGREYPHGETIAPDDANFDDTYGKVPPAMGPDEVGSHPQSQSPYGVQDMAGNVWEWTVSSLAKNEFAARGGSWYFGPNSSKTTDREVTESSFRDATVGMRVCVSLSR